MSTTPPSIQSLLAQSHWVHSVAQRLVADTHVAEDISQEAFVSLLETPPQHSKNLRGWFASVLQNRARQTGRSDTRRRQREQKAALAMPQEQASMDEIAEKAATQREVVGQVLDLPEPFRSVVLLRFFEDQTPPQIAERLDIPLKTVHSRLQRAFEKLRLQLDSSYGTRESWGLALMPLARTARPTPPAALTITASALLIMNTKAKLALFIGSVLLGGWAVYQRSINPEAAGPASLEISQEVSSPPPTTQAAGPTEPAKLEPERQAIVAAPPVEAEESEPTTSPTRTISGLALNTDGVPVVGVRVTTSGPNEVESEPTAADGSFSLLLTGPADHTWDFNCLSVRDQDWVTVRQTCLGQGQDNSQHLVLLASRRTIQGWVQDSDGAPIAQATVSLSHTRQSFFKFTKALDSTRLCDFETVTTDSGKFSFERFPDAPGLSLTVEATGYVLQRVILDSVDWPLTVELLRPQEHDVTTIHGIVLDPSGWAVEGATVQLGDNATVSGAGGIFALPLVSTSIHKSHALCASLEGYQSALVKNYGVTLEEEGDAPAAVELILGGAPLWIRGQIVNKQGEPLSGWALQLHDPTPVSRWMIPVISAEGLSHSGDVHLKTKEDGGFAIGGLYPREYTLTAHHKKTLQFASARFMAGDEEALFTVDAIEQSTFRGIVLDLAGNPIEGVLLSPCLRVSIGEMGYTSISNPGATTDEQGHFEIEFLPGPRSFLAYAGKHIISGTLNLGEALDSERQKLKIARRCHFRVELGSSYPQATSFRFLNLLGNELTITKYQSGGSTSSPSFQLSDGRSEVLAVSEAGTTLVVYNEDTELGRIDVQLNVDDVTVLRP